jgi:hypothetical protein
MTIIIFELFSGTDPFPGSFGQIYQAKMKDKKPVIPSDFPLDLKELVIQGWSKGPKERPSIKEFETALNKMFPKEAKDQYLTLQEVNSVIKIKKEGQLFSPEECENTQAGDPFKGLILLKSFVLGDFNKNLKHLLYRDIIRFFFYFYTSALLTMFIILLLNDLKIKMATLS